MNLIGQTGSHPEHKSLYTTIPDPFAGRFGARDYVWVDLRKGDTSHFDDFELAVVGGSTADELFVALCCASIASPTCFFRSDTFYIMTSGAFAKSTHIRTYVYDPCIGTCKRGLLILSCTTMSERTLLVLLFGQEVVSRYENIMYSEFLLILMVYAFRPSLKTLPKYFHGKVQWFSET